MKKIEILEIRRSLLGVSNFDSECRLLVEQYEDRF